MDNGSKWHRVEAQKDSMVGQKAIIEFEGGVHLVQISSILADDKTVDVTTIPLTVLRKGSDPFFQAVPWEFSAAWEYVNIYGRRIAARGQGFFWRLDTDNDLVACIEKWTCAEKLVDYGDFLDLYNSALGTWGLSQLREVPVTRAKRVVNLLKCMKAFEKVSSLLVIRGNDAESGYAIVEPATSIGRDPTNEIHLHDTEVSRRHAEIRRAEKGHDIIDLGSANGTFVNDNRVHSQSLASGDEVRIGNTVLLYWLGRSDI